MALLEKIRTKGGILLAIFVGLALFAFIMTDMLSSGGSLFTGSRNEVGKINGKSVDIQDFQNKVSEMEEFNKLNSGRSSMTEEESYYLREQVWNQYVSETILAEKYSEIGLQVTSEELKDMLTGKNIHPTVLQHPIFQNPETGAFDKNQVSNFLLSRSVDPTAFFYWAVLEEFIVNDQLINKYKDLLKQGMYTPKALQALETDARTKQVDFEYVMARYSSVADSLVNVSNNEVSQYYKQNINEFQQQATRDIEYIYFDITPSEEDVKASYDWVNKMVAELAKPEIDPAQFIRLNSDEPFVDRNFKLTEVSSEISDFLSSAKVGEVYGPYKEDESYKATKFISTVQVPDSAKARHILLQGASLEAANLEADSLIKVIKGGANFAEVARKHSVDTNSAINGGDLDWFTEGMMVKPFNDAVFYGKKGDIVKVESDFGVHIIHIQDLGRPSTKYQIATLVRNINYSTKTYHEIYAKANRFAAENNSVEKFNQAIEDENLSKRFGRNIGLNDLSVSGLNSSRELVKWAHESSVGSLSQAFEFDDKFVIAHLVSASKEGDTPLSKVEAQIKRELSNKKKAEYLISKLENASSSSNSLEDIANSVDANVATANDITFGSYQVPGAGVEPALVSLALNTEVGEISKPIKGNNGVYLVKVLDTKEVDVDENVVAMEIDQSNNTKIDYQLLQNLIDNATVVDKRHKFY